MCFLLLVLFAFETRLELLVMISSLVHFWWSVLICFYSHGSLSFLVERNDKHIMRNNCNFGSQRRTYYLLQSLIFINPKGKITYENELTVNHNSNTRDRHSSYLSQPPQPAVVYFFLAGVLFSIENATCWPILTK